jgi:hypothetical protein
MTTCPRCTTVLPPNGDTCPSCGKAVAGAALMAPTHEARMPTSATLVLLFAFTVAALGLLFASQATLGPTIVGIACLLGITARMVQASHQK